ncbi:MAG: cell division protein FtsX [Calditrichia bacterium]
MNIFFMIREGLAGFKRARLSATITIVTVMLSLLLIGIFGLVAQQLSDNFYRVYNKIFLEVFIDPSLSEGDVKALQRRIENFPAVRSTQYVTQEMALQAFEKDFGQDLMKVLGDNPLPPSFRVALKPTYSGTEQVERMKQELESFVEVDEVDYQQNFVKLMNDYFWIGLLTASFLGAAIFFITTMLIYNTIRLTIHSRHTVIEIMRLVGANRFFIKGPFIVEGVLQGLIGSLLACGILWLISDAVQTLFATVVNVPLEFYALLILIGISLGLLGSYISVGKYLKY